MEDEMETIIYREYYPPGVKQVLASGGSAFIGEVDESTVFKYPLGPGEEVVRLEIERQLLEIVGPHERIIGLKGFTSTGIYLERAVNGNLSDYLESDAGSPSIALLQRVAWAREAAEAVAHVHSRGVLHCDIQPSNLLLDEGLHVKLADFQGKQVSSDGEVLLDGWSSEPYRFSYPRRHNPDLATVKTDLFALGCTVYYLMLGRAVFPDIANDDLEAGEKIARRFAGLDFPTDEHVCSRVVSKCWRLEYECADEVVRDLVRVEESLCSSTGGEV